jgi:hypothetical protein
MLSLPSQLKTRLTFFSRESQHEKTNAGENTYRKKPAPRTQTSLRTKPALQTPTSLRTKPVLLKRELLRILLSCKQAVSHCPLRSCSQLPASGFEKNPRDSANILSVKTGQAAAQPILFLSPSKPFHSLCRLERFQLKRGGVHESSCRGAHT